MSVFGTFLEESYDGFIHEKMFGSNKDKKSFANAFDGNKDKKIFQNVFAIISEFLPEGWDRMVFFAGYTEGSYSMKFYSKAGKDKYVDCFSFPGVSKASLLKAFRKIDANLSKNRKELGKNNAWTIFTMVVDKNGKMKIDFDYDDHSEDMIAYEKEWAKKYLSE